MSRLGVVLGSDTRANVIEALALTREPMTSYAIARSYNMNVAKVYIETKRLARLGFLKRSPGGRGTVYELVDQDLRNLALKLSTRVIPYGVWKGEESRRSRLRAGLSAVPNFSIARRATLLATKPTRMEGELENLATLAKERFDSRYHKTSSRGYDRL